MATSMHVQDAPRSDSRDYRWIYALTLPLFVAVALLGRVAAIGRPRGRRGSLSLLGEARAAAHTVIPFAFMH